MSAPARKTTSDLGRVRYPNITIERGVAWRCLVCGVKQKSPDDLPYVVGDFDLECGGCRSVYSLVAVEDGGNACALEVSAAQFERKVGASTGPKLRVVKELTADQREAQRVSELTEKYPELQTVWDAQRALEDARAAHLDALKAAKRVMSLRQLVEVGGDGGYPMGLSKSSLDRLLKADAGYVEEVIEF